MVELAKTVIAAGHRVEYWTGRSEKTREMTEQWLNAHGIGNLPVRMRDHVLDERTADYRLKERLLEKHGKPDLIFEDRKSVVNMWRSHGILVAQVAEGDF